jgi:predicted ribonuclease YlaK
MKKMIYKFYDTCSLLLKANHLFDEEDVKIVISSITLQELEEIKTSRNKDDEIKFSARQVLRSLTQHKGDYDIHIFRENMLDPILSTTDFTVNNDLRILACAFDYDTNEHPDETIFVTNDLALAQIANLFFGNDSIQSINED